MTMGISLWAITKSRIEVGEDASDIIFAFEPCTEVSNAATDVLKVLDLPYKKMTNGENPTLFSKVLNRPAAVPNKRMEGTFPDN